jgi:hypothetical protein
MKKNIFEDCFWYLIYLLYYISDYIEHKLRLLLFSYEIKKKYLDVLEKTYSTSKHPNIKKIVDEKKMPKILLPKEVKVFLNTDNHDEIKKIVNSVELKSKENIKKFNNKYYYEEDGKFYHGKQSF